VDILNLAQPNLYDIPEVGRRSDEQVCFCCQVSYQTTSITSTREQIFEDVRVPVESLGCFNDGLLGSVEEYQNIGLSEAKYPACIEAFRTLGRYPGKSYHEFQSTCPRSACAPSFLCSILVRLNGWPDRRKSLCPSRTGNQIIGFPVLRATRDGVPRDRFPREHLTVAPDVSHRYRLLSNCFTTIRLPLRLP